MSVGYLFEDSFLEMKKSCPAFVLGGVNKQLDNGVYV